MAGKRREQARALDPMDEVARLLALNLKRERGLQEVIVELDKVGIRQARIAELLGTTGGYVNVALTRAKDQTTKKSTSRSKRAAAKGDE
jgi:CRP-like cAMP-binding protein